MSGVLYVVATPIGNLDDITRRGISVLSSVQMIAAEDTRRTQVLLAEIGSRQAELVALHAHNEQTASRRVIAALKRGVEVALVSDAGTPLLSDPGFDLVRQCWQESIPIVPIPGSSSVLAALSVCPLPTARFYFEGFLPARAGPRRARLRELLRFPSAVVFFEAPHRVAACLADLEALQPARRIMVGREMTKRHETYYCDTAGAVARSLQDTSQLRGEFVLVMEGSAAMGLDIDATRAMDILSSELAPAQAARIGAQLLDVDKSELYDLIVQRRKP
ncbi:MAG: 16S rRNA (cytidine(1402)-2'-O)-methyltransferase [Pseudomonadales bacterium]